MAMRALAVLILSMPLALGAVGVSLAKPSPVAPAAQSFQLGSFNVVALRDADNDLPNDGKVLGLDVGPAAVSEVLKAHGAPTDKITLGVDALLVETPGRTLLFDTGLGPKVGGVLMGSLEAAGARPEQVTDVFITHTHGDHVGGLATGDGKLAFPNAIIHMSAKEWAWMQAEPRMSMIAALISPKVEPFVPGAELAPGVKSVELYGHTPGHVGYEISSGGARLLDIGDTAHSSIVSLAKPEWSIQYDNDKSQGRATREALLAKVAASHELVFAPHFPYPGVGKIATSGDGYVFQPGLP